MRTVRGLVALQAFRDTRDFFGQGHPGREGPDRRLADGELVPDVMAQNSPDVNVAAVAFMDRQGKPFTFFTGSGWASHGTRSTAHSRARG
jgi:multiple sugar transport system substrate-binding protein